MCVYARTFVSFVGVSGVVRIVLYTWCTSTHVMVHKNEIFPVFKVNFSATSDRVRYCVVFVGGVVRMVVI